MARAVLLRAAMRTAARDGDRHPNDIEAVRTTHGQAERLSGEQSTPPPASAPVYVIAMRGHFSHRGSVPAGASAPHGSVITLELPVDLSQSGPSSFGLEDSYPNLGALGTPVRL